MVGVQGDPELGTEHVQFEILRAMNQTALQVLGGYASELMPKDTPTD